MYIHKYVPIRGQWCVPLIPLIRWYLSQLTLLRIDQSKSDDGDDVGSKPLTHIPRTLPSYIENSCPRKPKIILKLTIYICKKNSATITNSSLTAIWCSINLMTWCAFLHLHMKIPYGSFLPHNRTSLKTIYVQKHFICTTSAVVR